MHLKNISVLLIVVAIAGCATVGVPPTQSDFEKSKVFKASYSQVWSAIIAVIAESNLPITTLEKDSGIVAISNVIYEPSWANEGTRGSVLGVPDLVTQRVANFNILATRQSSYKTRVQVNSNFKINVRRGNGSPAFPFIFQWQQAYSNGTLERIILDGVTQKVH